MLLQAIACTATRSRHAQSKSKRIMDCCTSPCRKRIWYAAHTPLATSSRATAHVQQVKKRVIECTRSRTLASRAGEQIPGTARVASPTALNCTRPARDMLFTSLALPTRGELVATNALVLTPTVLPDWQQLHRAVIAHVCEADTRMRSDVRSCTPLNIAPLYIKFSRSISHFFRAATQVRKYILQREDYFPKR